MSFSKPNKIQIVKCAPPPPDLPVLGKEDQSEIVFIGRTNYVAALEEKKFVFGIKRVDRRRHMYILGKSGVGKTKFEELMVRQDIAYGQGVCIIDPNGDFIDDILNFIPEERVEDVCIIDPRDINYPISFNPFIDVSPVFKNQLVQCFVEILGKQFNDNWSSRLEHIFRFSVLALLDYPYATMEGLIEILKDKTYRDEVKNYIQDEMVKKFWDLEYEEWYSKYNLEIIIPLINKLGQFCSDPLLHNIFKQKENKINFEELINNKKIVLINLAKGELGDSNSSFFGAIFLMKIKQAGMAISRLELKDRKDFYIYMDEFQNIATPTFESIISEARKYNFSFILAHQYLAQLDEKVAQYVLGNVGTIISFRIGGEDATKLKPEFSPVFDIKDMINLGVGEFYIKMMIDGESYDPFSAESLRVLPPTHKSLKDEIIKSSRSKYSVSL